MKRIFLKSYAFLLFIFLVVIFFRPITAINDDLGRHILLGNIILSNHFVPATNLLSYTFPNYPFINTTWLYEVISALIVKHIGFNGLLFTSCVVAVSACIYQFHFVSWFVSQYFLLPGLLRLLPLRCSILPRLFVR